MIEPRPETAVSALGCLLRRATRAGTPVLAALTVILAPIQCSADSNLGANPPAETPALQPSTLSLDQAVADALQVDPSVRAANDAVAQAQAGVGAADAGQRFQISFTSAASGADAVVYQPPPSHETFGTLQNSFTVPVPVGRKPGLAVEQARDQLAVAQAQYSGARLAVIQEVVGAFYDLLRKQSLLDAAATQLQLAAREAAAAINRNKAGDVADLDVLQAQAPVAAAQTTVQRARTDTLVARETLNSLVGLPLDVETVPVDPGPATAPSYSLDDARSLCLVSSPNVAAAEAAMNAESAAEEGAKLYRDPALSLQAEDVRSGDQTSFSREDILQAQVSIPLDDGGLGSSQASAAAAALAQAAEQDNLARTSAILAVSQAYLSAQGAVSELAFAGNARDEAQTAYDKTTLGYSNGLFPLTDVITAQNALRQAQIEYIQAQYDAELNRRILDIDVYGEAAIDADAPSPAPTSSTGNSKEPK